MNGIECPTCGEVNSKVGHTHQEPSRIRRRRICKSCGTRWNTKELNSGGISVGQLANDASNRAFGTVPNGEALTRFDQEKEQ